MMFLKAESKREQGSKQKTKEHMYIKQRTNNTIFFVAAKCTTTKKFSYVWMWMFFRLVVREATARASRAFAFLVGIANTAAA